MSITLNNINEMNRQQFIDTFGGIFEHSPWIAEQAWKEAPFGSVPDLIASFEQSIWNADGNTQLALLRAHPDLGARVTMTSHSVKEQAGAGLNALSEQEYTDLLRLNERYTQKFAFPFIMAVKGQTKERIFQAIRERVEATTEEEKRKALQEVCKIGRFRLDTILAKDAE